MRSIHFVRLYASILLLCFLLTRTQLSGSSTVCGHSTTDHRCRTVQGCCLPISAISGENFVTRVYRSGHRNPSQIRPRMNRETGKSSCFPFANLWKIQPSNVSAHIHVPATASQCFPNLCAYRIPKLKLPGSRSLVPAFYRPWKTNPPV